MTIILITGMSGAGKSVALKTLEDAGFEAIDNAPLALLPAIAVSGSGAHKVAVGVDARSRGFSTLHFRETVAPLRTDPALDVKVLFLDCDDEALRRRFTETRRRHPLAQDGTLDEGIRRERRLIEGLHDAADLVIDTSDCAVADLRRIVTAHFMPKARALVLSLVSFSYRRGLPREADLVFDVRFLKNPYYNPELKHLNGLDAAVGKAIEADAVFADFYARLTGLLAPLLPCYLEEGKHYLTIAVGCTGGRHRSVYMVQKLGEFFREGGYNITLRHRDLEAG
ncbi:MAG: RNase adapter RapZ [Pseudomonadota bacterium]|nr:RNase adapter RapZ [Pseudomonadota bacterium]MDE3038324.1 RNase adapter RapZ [Pseudomonadota bacterium]